MFLYEIECHCAPKFDSYDIEGTHFENLIILFIYATLFSVQESLMKAENTASPMQSESAQSSTVEKVRGKKLNTQLLPGEQTSPSYTLLPVSSVFSQTARMPVPWTPG